MQQHQYIIPVGEVGVLAQAAAIQDATITFLKDPQSAFYLARTAQDIEMPTCLHVLEMKSPIVTQEPTPVREASKEKGQLTPFMELRLRMHLPEGVNRQRFEALLQAELGHAVERAILQQFKEESPDEEKDEDHEED